MLQQLGRQLRAFSTSPRALGQVAEFKGTQRQETTTHSILHDSNTIVPKIGLEVHAQLNTESKLFSLGGVKYNAPPNTQLDLFDVSLPGTLPKLNGEALRAAILSSLALNCNVQDLIHFDRKNYFYPDMPAGYQITQYSKPIAKDGYIEFIVTSYHRSVIAHSQQYDLVKYLYSEDRGKLEEVVPYIKRSHIKQVQLEQDSAKTLQQVNSKGDKELYSLVDYNRSGTGLIEIVFEPDLCSQHEASSLVKELILILRNIGTCSCELQEGSLRVDANISIKRLNGKELSSNRVELKNLNSLRALNRAIEYEIIRQAELISSGETVLQETRTYDTKLAKTIPLRVKEESVDYRYMPEPNIPPLKIERDFINEIRKELPLSMSQTVRNHMIREWSLDLRLIDEILCFDGLGMYMINIMKNRPNYDAAVIADFLIYTAANLSEIQGSLIKVDFNDDSEFMEILRPQSIQTIFDMIAQDEISFAKGYDLIKYIYLNRDASDPRKLVNDFGWYQINDHAKIMELCLNLVKGMKNISKRYSRDGEKRHLRMMLDKLCEKTGDRISIRKSIECLNEILRSSK